MKKENVNADHVAKQKKRKNLSDEYVYSSLGGIVEMHKLGQLKLSNFDDKTIDKLFGDLIKENGTLNERLDNTKTALKEILKRTEIIEGKMKTYGLK